MYERFLTENLNGCPLEQILYVYALYKEHKHTSYGWYILLYADFVEYGGKDECCCMKDQRFTL